MNKIMPLIGAVALVAAVSFSAIAPAAAAPYHHHYYGPGPGVAIGAGVLGFMAGAAIANSARGNAYDDGYYDRGGWRAHVEACYDRYRSYDRRSDTYLGFDGYRHRCTL